MSVEWTPGPVLVAGPCALEHDDVNLEIADVLARVGERLGLRVVFKGSFDKANRSRADAPRGLGLDAGLEALTLVRTRTGLPVLTDVHDVEQTEPVARVVDVIQVPAFLCRQTDLLVAAGRTGCAVNVKKGQWMSADGMAGAAEKVRAAGGRQIAVTERGTFFGYGDLVVDMRNFDRLRARTGSAVLFDATHAVQQPDRGWRGTSGGCREAVPALLAAAAAAGADGFYLETHPRPEQAPSDGATMWPLGEVEPLLARTVDVWQCARGWAGDA